jgi:hypothetical protein
LAEQLVYWIVQVYAAPASREESADIAIAAIAPRKIARGELRLKTRNDARRKIAGNPGIVITFSSFRDAV